MNSSDNRNRRLAVRNSDVPKQQDSEFTDTSSSISKHNDVDDLISDLDNEAYQYGFTKKPKRSSSKSDMPSSFSRIKLRVILSVVAGFLGVVIGVICFGFWYKDYLLNQITYETTERNAVITIINEEGNTVPLQEVIETTKYEIIQDEPIKNFLLIGIDSRANSYNSSGTGDRSDVICVMSVDMNKGTIKLLSIQRDSYAYFPGYSTPHKINAAMAYGGPDLLQATVESCLRIKIDGYAYVNFSHMAQIIDAVGGVYVNMTAGERNVANDYIKRMNSNAALIQSTGSGTWLNGIQAVGYARVRYVGNGDYERMERQIEVLRSVMSQYMKLSATGKLAAMDDVLSAVVTNIDKSDIERLGLEFLPSLQNAEMQYIQLPIEGCYNAGMYGDEWSVRINWNAIVPYVQEYFYGTTTEFDEVKVPNHVPSLENCDTDIPLENLIH
ncbi:MAG: LCP family protein [Saccharofermentans sp.]|nr:LCP family protein [Saccharofermentans sp.]